MDLQSLQIIAVFIWWSCVNWEALPVERKSREGRLESRRMLGKVRYKWGSIVSSAKQTNKSALVIVRHNSWQSSFQNLHLSESSQQPLVCRCGDCFRHKPWLTGRWPLSDFGHHSLQSDDARWSFFCLMRVSKSVTIFRIPEEWCVMDCCRLRCLQVRSQDLPPEIPEKKSMALQDQPGHLY